MSSGSQDAKEGAKNMNLGLPLSGKQLKAFADMFSEGKYFGHVKFGLENKRLEPEDLIKHISKKSLDGTGFLLLLGFLLRNGLDVNYYFQGPYDTAIHIAVYIYSINQNSTQGKYIFNLLESAGSSFYSEAYTGSRKISKETVYDTIGRKDISPGENYDISDFFGIKKENLNWEIMKTILLDKSADSTTSKNLTDFLEKTEKKFLTRMVILYIMI